MQPYSESADTFPDMSSIFFLFHFMLFLLAFRLSPIVALKLQPDSYRNVQRDLVYDMAALC